MSQVIDEFLARSPRFVTIVGDDGHVYGVQTSQVAVTTTSGQVVATNARRVSWTMCNFGTANAFVSWAANASTTVDFPILANGGVLETSQIDDKNIARLMVQAVGSAATTIAVIEVIRID